MPIDLSLFPSRLPLPTHNSDEITPVISRPAHIPRTAPVAAPVTAQQLLILAEALQSSRNTLVITGAGVSTESGIPDYRGVTGAYTTGFKPMTHQQFMASELNRVRYWSRSFAGWQAFSSSRPNAAHEALARLQARGWVGDIITQNVDRLHQAGGSHDSRVLELHGTTHVGCRHAFQNLLADLNDISTLSVDRSFQREVRDGREGALQVPLQRPDGDMELTLTNTFRVPACPSCAGILKPDVVFFGDSLPPERTTRTLEMSHDCDLIIAVGTSLMTRSSFRLVEAAKKSSATFLVINCGATRADSLADSKLEVLAGEALMRLACQPRFLVNRS
ncbi:MAG: hypothetical protein WDW38_004301 [Sanguina aurantia]